MCRLPNAITHAGIWLDDEQIDKLTIIPVSYTHLTLPTTPYV